MKQRVGLTNVAIVYSRPSAKSRTIQRGIVLYEREWRAGANPATKVVFSTPLKLQGTDIPAGADALFSIFGNWSAGFVSTP